MFKNSYPLFEEKHLLTKEMLENLRDYPRMVTDHLFSDFADGIVSGCKITWDQGELMIGSGMVWRKGKLYFLKEAFRVACGAMDSVRYLKIRFTECSQETGSITERGGIVLEDRRVDSESEMELCRFRLQEGAKLRCEYENFEDYSTEFDTVDQIDTPYAAKGKSAMKPELLVQYAREMIKKGSFNPLDLVFAMEILAQDGRISMEGILAYLDGRMKGGAVDKAYGGESGGRRGVYCKLLKILKELDTDAVTRGGMPEEKNRKILLL